jgi:hypothetical protein
MTSCNSLYFFNLSVIKWVKSCNDTIHHIWNCIHMQLMQLDHCNYCAIMLQLLCHYIAITMQLHNNNVLMWHLWVVTMNAKWGKVYIYIYIYIYISVYILEDGSYKWPLNKWYGIPSNISINSQYIHCFQRITWKSKV